MALVMTMSPTAIRTARRNLVQRIDRFVRRIQTEGFQPGPDAIANFEYGFAPRFPQPTKPPADWRAYRALRPANRHWWYREGLPFALRAVFVIVLRCYRLGLFLGNSPELQQ
jgi:hypothetical protein